MKKTLLIFIAISLVGAVHSQTSRVEGARKLTVAEANQLNGVAQPTINGKPYSQYKAEQEALKRQKPAQQAVVASGGPSASNKGTLPIQQSEAQQNNEGPATGTGEIVTGKAKDPAPVQVEGKAVKSPVKTETTAPAAQAAKPPLPSDANTPAGTTNSKGN